MQDLAWALDKDTFVEEPGRNQESSDDNSVSDLWPSKRFEEYKKRQRVQLRQKAREELAERSEEPEHVDQKFKLRVRRWEGHHRAYIETTKWFNPFGNNAISPMQQDLFKRIPLSALSDIDPSGTVSLRQLRAYEAEVKKRPKLRDWVKEREAGGREPGWGEPMMPKPEDEVVEYDLIKE